MKTLEYGSEYIKHLRIENTDFIGALRDSATDEGDMAEGIYWFCADWHGGQSSALYACLSCNPFSPGPLSNGPDSDGAKDVYSALETIVKTPTS